MKLPRLFKRRYRRQCWYCERVFTITLPATFVEANYCPRCR